MLTQEIKEKYVERATMHQKAGDFEKNHYWDGTKGCAVGCLAHDKDNPHETLAKELDTPEWVFRCTDTIFEGLPLEESKKWPVDFIKALPVGLTNEQWDGQIKAPFLNIISESIQNISNAPVDRPRDDIDSFCLKVAGDATRTAVRWGDAAYAVYAACYAAFYAAVAARAASTARAARAARYKYFAEQLLLLMKETQNQGDER